MAIYSGFTHKKWWFSIAMLVYQRVSCISSSYQPWQARSIVASRHWKVEPTAGFEEVPWPKSRIHMFHLAAWMCSGFSCYRKHLTLFDGENHGFQWRCSKTLQNQSSGYPSSLRAIPAAGHWCYPVTLGSSRRKEEDPLVAWSFAGRIIELLPVDFPASHVTDDTGG